MFPLIEQPGGGVVHPLGHALDTLGVLLALGWVGCCVIRVAVGLGTDVLETLVIDGVTLILVAVEAAVVGIGTLV